MADSRVPACFVGKLKDILAYELSIGNTIVETYHGNWPYAGVFAVVLANPFSPPIYRDLEGITFRNINDPHYWKAEYYDAFNNQLLLCRFGDQCNLDNL